MTMFHCILLERKNTLTKTYLIMISQFKALTSRYLFLFICLFLNSCSQVGSQFSGINMYSTREELELGYQYSIELEKQLSINYDSLLNQYINSLGQRLVKSSNRNNIPYTFKIVNDRSINAFAIPGGYCYINLGLIDLAESEAELASVISHEIAHVVGEHGMENMTKQQIIGFAGAMILGARPTFTEEIISSIIQRGVLTNFSRGAELEADRLGIQQMHAAGIDPIGFESFLKKMRDQEKGENSQFSKMLSTHPPTSLRIKKSIETRTSLSRKKYDADDESFLNMKQHLNRNYKKSNRN